MQNYINDYNQKFLLFMKPGGLPSPPTFCTKCMSGTSVQSIVGDGATTPSRANIHCTSLNLWTSKKGSPFINESLLFVIFTHHIAHRSLTPYTLWTNCSIDHLSQDLLSAFHSGQTELHQACAQLAWSHWAQSFHS